MVRSQAELDVVPLIAVCFSLLVMVVPTSQLQLNHNDTMRGGPSSPSYSARGQASEEQEVLDNRVTAIKVLVSHQPTESH